MKINAINYNLAKTVQRGDIPSSVSIPKLTYPKVISLSEFKKQGLSFTGNTIRNKEQVIFIGAESDPYSKAGGVGTVMKDYRNYTKPENQAEIIPYYGAENNENIGVKPLKKDGEYVMPTSKGNIKLQLIQKKTMQWGKEKDSEIFLFKPKDDNKNLTYIVFVDDVASMKKPYQNAYVYRSGAKQDTNGWNGDPYAKFSKAAIEFLPDIMKNKPNFNPATVVCSDSQSAYAIEYMAQKAASEDEKHKVDGIKPTYVGHNLGPGYCGETSMQNMFVNLGATPEDIKHIENDPMYRQGIKGDRYFEPFVKKALDETGVASAVEIPLYWADKNYVKSFSVVAEEYAKSIAENPQTAHNIHNSANKLYEKGVFNGILNPLNDPAVDATKPLQNELYNKDCTDADGTIYPKFEVYPENPTYEDAKRIKNSNKEKLLKRLSAKDTTIITGNPSRKADINPELKTKEIIKPELIKLIEEGRGDEVPLFVSWGRADTQKGHDITLDAFEKFAKTKEGKNAILILGAGLDDGKESTIIRKKIESMLKDPELKGRVAHIDGWAPAYAMASAADGAIFSSRFEPCGLTDLEAMKYYCTPIVVNTQGLKQKNFDPRNKEEHNKATSYKTKHEYNLLKSQVELILNAYENNDQEAKKELIKEFPTFVKEDENGNKTFDDAFFKDFVKTHKEFLDKKKKEISKRADAEDILSTNWSDWDELSKDYSFQFGGHARQLKDGILVSEIADALQASINSDIETKKLIFNNLKNLNTSWSTNGPLHPSGKSSKELYKERHLDSDYTEPKPEDTLKPKEEEIEKTIEKEQSKDIKERATTYSIGSLLGIVGIIAGRLGSKAANEAKISELENELKTLSEKFAASESTIKNLEEKLVANAKRAKKTTILASAICAASAALITGITAFIIHKHSKAKESSLSKPDTVELSKTQTSLSPLNLTLNEFKNSLNK